MSFLHIKAENLRHEIRSLIHQNPELEEDDVLRADMVEGETSFDQIVDVILRKWREAQTMHNAVHDEIEGLMTRAERYHSRMGALRKLLQNLMDMAGTSKVERPTATLSLNAGKPSVAITDINQLPDGYIRTKKEPNKQVIALALKSGMVVPGAQWNNSPPHLTIRTS